MGTNLMKKNAYFITGTDTGVGKTTVGCALARAFRERGLQTGVMKPVETGCSVRDGVLIPADAVSLRAAAESIDPLNLINPYRFTPPLAPSVAARLAGVDIEFNKIKKNFDEISQKNDVTLIEGAGGLLVPLSREKTVADLIAFLDIPVIVVAASKLGCLNHTLLTAKHAACIGLNINTVILNHPDSRMDDSQQYNHEELQSLCKMPVKKLPFLSKGELDLNAIAAELCR